MNAHSDSRRGKRSLRGPHFEELRGFDWTAFGRALRPDIAALTRLVERPPMILEAPSDHRGVEPRPRPRPWPTAVGAPSS